MPNGGPDNCGTCWFNRANGGKDGHGNHDPSIPSYCEIRDLDIPDPFYTYCSNHPRRVVRRDPVPIGPVFVANLREGNREVWVESPDTEEIRLHLLGLLADSDSIRGSWPFSDGFVRDVIAWQLLEFDERRAIPLFKKRVDELERLGEDASRVRQGLLRLQEKPESGGPI